MRALILELLKTLSPETKNRISRLVYMHNMPRDILFCMINRLKYNATWRFYGLPLIEQRRKGSIVIGDCFVATSDPRYNSMGVFQKVIIKALTSHSQIKIGNNVGVSGCSISCREHICIEDNVLIGTGSMIVDHDAHQIDSISRRYNKGNIKSSPVIIHEDVFIGARAIILKGVEIGRASIVAAGSVVSRSVPAGVIVAGNPARVVGDSD